MFAEDYDVPAKSDITAMDTNPSNASEVVFNTHVPEEAVISPPDYIHEVFACPNRSNPYHICVQYCKKQYGLKAFSPVGSMLSRRERMLRKYPLPEGWNEVADPNTYVENL